MFSINSYPGFTACLFVLLQKKNYLLQVLSLGKELNRGLHQLTARKEGRPTNKTRKMGRCMILESFNSVDVMMT